MSEQDIKDAVQSGVKAAEAKAKTGAGQNGKAQRTGAAKNFPFKVDEGGVWKRVRRDNDDGTASMQWVRFGTELHVLGLTRNGENENWGRYLEIVDRDGTRHAWAMPAALLAGSGDQLRGELLRLGFEPESRREAKAWTLEYLLTAPTAQRARCVDGIGWHGATYVLPDGPIGARDGDELIILQSAEKPDHAYNVAGSLDDWKTEVARPALGNSRLVLAIATAFAAPMLALSGDDGGGFHFRGASSSGKSTALDVAGSVWGGGGTGGFKKTWRTTDNALESIATMSRDNLLCLDELSQVDPRAAGAAAYMLANGRGKARAGREGQARKVLEWRLLFLSSGEMGLGDKIKEGGGQIAAGMEVRVIDLRADAGAGLGLFEDVHGATNPAAFSQTLRQSANACYGAAGRAFVAALAKDLPEYRDRLGELRRMFVQDVVPDGADGQVRRVADRFALVAAAGEIATVLDLTGWPTGAVVEATRHCFQDWLKERGGHGSSEVAEAKRRIAETIQLHGSSRFQRWAKSSSDRMVITHRMGFVKIEGDPDIEETESTFYFMAEPFRELLAGLDRRSMVGELMALGVIVSQSGKPNKVCHVSSGGGKFRLYQIDRAKLDAIPAKVDD